MRAKRKEIAEYQEPRPNVAEILSPAQRLLLQNVNRNAKAFVISIRASEGNPL
jgi:hypothetical protein